MNDPFADLDAREAAIEARYEAAHQSILIGMVEAHMTGDPHSLDDALDEGAALSDAEDTERDQVQAAFRAQLGLDS